MSNDQALILLGGCFNLGFGLFHLGFWKFLDWKSDLASLSFINRGVMQVLNIFLTYVFFVFAYISFVHVDDLLTTSLGASLLLAISLFWLLRAGAQIVFFGLEHWLSWLLLLAFLVGSLLYAIPAGLGFDLKIASLIAPLAINT
ncbi:MAG: hypothetical protein GWP50_06010 [Proteobacteria bacterium]|nr:hypothetical protein [Pseudomonadota bacterium]